MGAARFGVYELHGRLGCGGMAEVLRAVDTRTGRPVALKRVLPHLVGDPRWVALLTSEAHRSMALDHPNIVRTFENGAVDGTHYIAMELVSGVTLRELLRQRAMQAGQAGLGAFVAREICRALAYAHAATDPKGQPLGLVHRDVSPSNVLISVEGAVKLADFGVAKALAEAAEKTATGVQRGKAEYLAPERAANAAFDHRADLFSVGVVLYEILSGRLPTQAPSSGELDAPSDLADVCLRALAPRPEARFASAAEMIAVLDPIVERMAWGSTQLRTLVATATAPVDGVSEATAPMPAPHRDRARRGLLLAAGLVCVVALAAAALRRRDRPMSVVAAPATVPVPTISAAPAASPEPPPPAPSPAPELQRARRKRRAEPPAEQVTTDALGPTRKRPKDYMPDPFR
jgi:serine/threonine protein kinase